MKYPTNAQFERKIALHRAEVATKRLLAEAKPLLEAAGHSPDKLQEFGRDLWRRPYARLGPIIQSILERHQVNLKDADRRKLDRIQPIRDLMIAELGFAAMTSIMATLDDAEKLAEMPAPFWRFTLYVTNGGIKAEATFEEDQYLGYQFQCAVAT